MIPKAQVTVDVKSNPDGGSSFQVAASASLSIFGLKGFRV